MRASVHREDWGKCDYIVIIKRALNAGFLLFFLL